MYEEKVLEKVIHLSGHFNFTYCAILSHKLLARLIASGGPQHKILVFEKLKMAILKNISKENSGFLNESFKLLQIVRE
jgi:hypothetical protein